MTIKFNRKNILNMLRSWFSVRQLLNVSELGICTATVKVNEKGNS